MERGTFVRPSSKKVQSQPDKTFLVFEDQQEQVCSYTYSQFDQMVNRTANGLLELGVRRGDKVNLHMANCPEFLFFWFAIAKVGAVMVPTNPASPPDELGYPVEHSESVVSVTQPDLLSAVEAVRQRGSGIRHIVLLGSGEAPPGVVRFDKLVESRSRTSWPLFRSTPWTRPPFSALPAPAGPRACW